MKTIKHSTNKEFYKKEIRAHHKLYRIDNVLRELQDYIIPKSIDWKIPPGILADGNVTDGTLTSLTDDTANWLPDQYKDKICKIFKNGGTDYTFGIIKSNNGTTLYFDYPLLAAPCNLCEYEIIHSLVLDPDDLPIMVAVDARYGKGGVILPKSTPTNERLVAHVYIEEEGFYDDGVVPIMCREEDTIAGVKYATLELHREAVRLYAHQWRSPHYDIAATYNINRLASAYWTGTSSLVSNNVFEYVTPESVIATDIARRMTPHVIDGNVWWRYTALIPKYFQLKFSANVDKTGGTGDIEIMWRLRYPDGTIEDLDTHRAQTRFGAGIGEDSIDVFIPIQMFRNYEVTPVAAKSGGNFTIDVGSSILISEI